MREGVVRKQREDGQDVFGCRWCWPPEGDGNGRFLARVDPHGLWLWCKVCHAARLASWSLIATTLTSYCAPPAEDLAILHVATLAELR